MIIKLRFPDSLSWFYYLPLGVIWSLAFYRCKTKRNEITKAHLLVSIVGVVCGFIWTYYVSGLLIDILTMVGVLTHLEATYLALTIIAIGNALPDALITIALAKKG